MGVLPGRYPPEMGAQPTLRTKQATERETPDTQVIVVLSYIQEERVADMLLLSKLYADWAF